MKLVVMTSIATLAALAAQAQPNAATNPASKPTNPPASNPSAPPPVERISPATQNPSTLNPSAINPSSSSPYGNDAMAADRMTEQAARQKLSGTGYGSVSSLKRNANGEWEAMTKKGSKQQRVTIANDGTVSPLAPM